VVHGKIIIAFQSFHDRERDDYLVGNVHHDDFVELVRRVLANPVRVEDAESTAAAADTLLGDGLQVAGGLQAVDTVGDRLAVGAALGNGALAAAAAHSDAVDAEALSGPVAQAASLVGPSGARGTVDTVELAVLPTPHTQQEAHNITLLLPVQFLHVLVRTHFCRQPTFCLATEVVRTQDPDGNGRGKDIQSYDANSFKEFCSVWQCWYAMLQTAISY